MPPSVQRIIHVPSNDLNCDCVPLRLTARHRAIFLPAKFFAVSERSPESQGRDVVTNKEPFAVSQTPASRSSIGESEITFGPLSSYRHPPIE